MGTGTVTVHNGIMDMWGNPDKQELYRLALDNTQKRFKGRVCNIMEIMGEIISTSPDIDPDVLDCFFEMDSVYQDDFCPMYMASNVAKLNGANTMLYCCDIT